MSEINAESSPYLSVVVTTRNDDHGGDPLKRLQAFVNCFEHQCRRSGLNAEVIVVEWNPPDDRPRVGDLLRLPESTVCSYRFITVPPALHASLRFADVLPLFQMIAKNVGIRRARGEYVLATNIDIIFSTELVDYLASRRLQPNRLYRVDRHDIDADFPADAPLGQQMDYCRSHQRRVHERWGTYPTDRAGTPVSTPGDIVDGRSVALGRGWHTREGIGGGACVRWASAMVELVVDPAAAGLAGETALDIDMESNPHTERSAVTIFVVEDGATLAQETVSGRASIAVPLGRTTGAARRLQLRASPDATDQRGSVPLFNVRGGMYYRVHGLRVRPAADCGPAARFEYWRRRSLSSTAIRRRLSTGADAICSWISARLPAGVRFRIVRAAPEYIALGGHQLARLFFDAAAGLADLHRFLLETRPENIHVNACGDFQLMAREQWHALRGYPEFETFSMSIDGLFSYIADAAGVKEQVLDAPIYHLEHEVGSGWSPEGEAALRQRIAERGIAWFDFQTVYIWAAYMRWLRRAFIFNSSEWGFGDKVLPERVLVPAFEQSSR
jgi:hypothetical protein